MGLKEGLIGAPIEQGVLATSLVTNCREHFALSSNAELVEAQLGAILSIPPWAWPYYLQLELAKGDSMTKRFWSCALITLVSAGASAGFSLEGLLGPGSPVYWSFQVRR